MAPICVRLPMGSARPRLTASTPAMKVVLTAPKPTSSTPSLPLAGAISTPFCPDAGAPFCSADKVDGLLTQVYGGRIAIRGRSVLPFLAQYGRQIAVGLSGH